ncbi:MAG: CBS domain-containing protein [Anaerolineales bacterium]
MEQIGKWMKREVVSISPDATLREVAALILEKRVGTLPVVDDEGTVVGVVSITEIVKMFLPDFVTIMDEIDFVHDYGDLENASAEDRQRAKMLHVFDIMEEAIAMEEDAGLVHALSVMEKHNLRDLIVIREGRLVGIASQVDIGRAFLTEFTKETGPLFS